MRAMILGALLLAALDASAKCLDSSADVTLEGRIATRDYPGPPNYRDIAAGDQKQTVFLLQLETPRCVTREDGGEARLGELQLAFDWASPRGSTVYQDVASADAPLRLTGALFSAATREHRTPWLLLVSEAERVP